MIVTPKWDRWGRRVQMGKWLWNTDAAIPVVQREDLGATLRADAIADRINGLELMVEGQREMLMAYRLGSLTKDTTFKKLEAAEKIIRRTAGMEPLV